MLLWTGALIKIDQTLYKGHKQTNQNTKVTQEETPDDGMEALRGLFSDYPHGKGAHVKYVKKN